jgi:hypothetical protein
MGYLLSSLCAQQNRSASIGQQKPDESKDLAYERKSFWPVL